MAAGRASSVETANVGGASQAVLLDKLQRMVRPVGSAAHHQLPGDYVLTEDNLLKLVRLTYLHQPDDFS